jgi:hypothetical protein
MGNLLLKKKIINGREWEGKCLHGMKLFSITGTFNQTKAYSLPDFNLFYTLFG